MDSNDNIYIVDNIKDEAGPSSAKGDDTPSADDDRSSDAKNSVESQVSGRVTNVAASRGQRQRKSTRQDIIKRSKRLTGRVVKKTRPVTKRQVTRRAPKRKTTQRKKRNPSVSTVFTRVASSGSGTPPCHYCGHCCCKKSNNRYTRSYRGYYRTGNNYRKKYKLNKRKLISVGFQVGSRSNMLSPLCITTNAVPQETPKPPTLNQEITPEMIHEALRHLTMWRQNVPTSSILEYLMRNFPFNGDKAVLMADLVEKLNVAVIIGFVCCTSPDTWGLNELQRELSPNHVTLFWKVYADTLKPIIYLKKEKKPENSNNEPETKEKTYVDDIC